MGRFELIIGPMFASKTTELISIANRYKSIEKKILVVNHKCNERYGTKLISTHDKTVFEDCVVVEKLESIYNFPQYVNADIILIEELQFYPDAFKIITHIADFTSKTVIAVGLSGDINRKPFGDVLRLIPHAEKVLFLSSLCKYCRDGTKAYFTRLCQNQIPMASQIAVGADEMYEAVCRKHYLRNNKQ